MKYNLLLLLCAVALANADRGNGCPNDWSVERLIPHKDCDKFYQCWNGERVLHTCPSNPQLYFNPKLGICDWPEEVDCSNREKPGNIESNEDDVGVNSPGNSDPSQAGAICAAEGSDGVLVAHEHCNKFYKCLAGAPVTLNCPGGLLYAPQTEQCDWPENVQCGDRVIPGEDNNGNENGNENGGQQGGGNSDPSQAGDICAAEGSDGFLVAHEDCNKFYKCLGGTPVALSCPGGLLYAPQLEQCDWPENVHCSDRVIPGEDNNGNGNGNENGGQQGGGNSDPSQAGDICAAEGSDGVLIAHEDCNKFYKCLGGTPVELSCPGGLLYAPQLEQCDWPENVHCSDRVIPGEDNNGNGNGNENGAQQGGGNSDPSQAGDICAAEGSDGVLVAHVDCNKFYKCLGGTPVALSCPGGLLYAPQLEQCDWPENVQCSDRVIPGEDNNGNGNGNENGGQQGGGNSDPSQAGDICAAEGSDGVLVAHEDCNKFYKCLGGTPIALSCPGGLLYAPQLEQCDWPENVKCGDRVIPGEDNNGNGNENENGGQQGGGNSDPSQAGAICAAEGSDGILVAHENCNKFYKCLDGTPAALSCPGGLLYAPEKEQCDWPENVDCKNRW